MQNRKSIPFRKSEINNLGHNATLQALKMKLQITSAPTLIERSFVTKAGQPVKRWVKQFELNDVQNTLQMAIFFKHRNLDVTHENIITACEVIFDTRTLKPCQYVKTAYQLTLTQAEDLADFFRDEIGQGQSKPKGWDYV